MQPEGIRQIVEYVFHTIENVSAHIEHGDRANADLHSVPPGEQSVKMVDKCPKTK